MSYKSVKREEIMSRLFSKSIKNSDIKLSAREFGFISAVGTLKEQSLTSLFFFSFFFGTTEHLLLLLTLNRSLGDSMLLRMRPLIIS